MQHFIRFVMVLSICLMITSALDAQTNKPKEKPRSGPNEIQFHEVPRGTAEGIVKVLQKIYANDNQIRYQVAGPSRLFVYADPQTHEDIARIIANVSPPPSDGRITQIIPLTTLEAARLLESLRNSMRDASSPLPFIAVHPERNALIVRGTENQIKDLKELIRVLDEDVKKSNTRTIRLENGAARTMAEAIYLLFPKIRENPNEIKLIIPGNLDLDRNKIEPPRKEPKSRPPVTLFALGDRLTITTDDREAMALILNMCRVLQAEVPICEPERIQLKQANAVEQAKLLDEMFNGPKDGKDRVERIRIIADPATNSILFRAKAIDSMTIRRLLRDLK